MSSVDLRRAYFTALGIKSDEQKKISKALDRSHAYRTLEIQLYWQRATYYWAFQAAVFAAFGLVLSTDPNWQQWMVLLVLCVAGILTAYAGVLGAKGSKFWQENWEKQVDMLESTIEGDLHKTVWLKCEKSPYSVTKINERLSWCLFATWLFLLGVTAYHSPGIGAALQRYLGTIPQTLANWIVGLLVLFGGIAAGLWLHRAKSGLSGKIFEKHSGDWKVFPTVKCADRWTLLRRLAPDEVWLAGCRETSDQQFKE